MALKSMTGFGEGTASSAGIRVTAEISSVNRRQLDINVSLPRSLSALDARVQGQIRKEFSRGRISGVIRVETVGRSASTVRIDEPLATEYIEGLRRTAKRLKLPDDLGADSLTRLPGLISMDQADVESSTVSTVLDEALGRALRGLARMRNAEGRELATDLRTRLALLADMIKQISALAPTVVKDQRAKLFNRLEEAGLSELAADERIVKELALFADRADISEEITRLKSHLSQARKLLRSTEPAGRTLDFLCQEFFREINTIGSKSGHIEITRLTVDFKTELERIREQVQNIE